jgi:hypothetical protein
MQQRDHDDEQTRAAEYPPKPLGSLATSALSLQARYGLDFLFLAPVSTACYTAAGRVLSGAKGQVLAKQAMNSLPA